MIHEIFDLSKYKFRRFGVTKITQTENKSTKEQIVADLSSFLQPTCADLEGGTRGPYRYPPLPLKNCKAVGFLSNTVPDPMKNHKATKPAFNVGPAKRADDGPLIVVFGSSLPLSTKKNCDLSELDPSDKTFWIRV